MRVVALEQLCRPTAFLSGEIGVVGVAIEVYAVGHADTLAFCHVACELGVLVADAVAAAQDRGIHSGFFDIVPVYGALVLGYVDHLHGGGGEQLAVAIVERLARNSFLPLVVAPSAIRKGARV